MQIKTLKVTAYIKETCFFFQTASFFRIGGLFTFRYAISLSNEIFETPGLNPVVYKLSRYAFQRVYPLHTQIKSTAVYGLTFLI